MGIEEQKEGIVKLPAQFTINCVEEQTNIISKMLAKNSEVMIDAADLQQIDTAGLQLLVAGAKEGKIRGKPFVLVKITEHLQQIAAITGADKIISLKKEG